MFVYQRVHWLCGFDPNVSGLDHAKISEMFWHWNGTPSSKSLQANLATANYISEPLIKPIKPIN